MDQILELVESVGGWKNVGIGAAAFVVVVVVIKRLMPKQVTDQRYSQQVRCGSCGWTGTVSQHRPKCPSCAADL